MEAQIMEIKHGRLVHLKVHPATFLSTSQSWMEVGSFIM